MWKMKGKVPPEWARPALLAAKKMAKKMAKKSAKKSAMQSAKQLDQGPVGGLAPAHPWSAEREVIVSRVRRFSPWVLLGIVAAAPLAPAAGQNLDAGKPGSQIFAEVCANCHRSPRELKGNPGTSFLREHYTTGSDMASTMSAYLSSSGSDPRVGGAPQPKRQPQANPTPTTTTRDAPAVEQPRRAQQTTDPKDPKAAAVAPATTRGRPGSVAETKPSSPPAPTRPVLEDFEE
jgi:mono/diheme cytochrome c family protein